MTEQNALKHDKEHALYRPRYEQALMDFADIDTVGADVDGWTYGDLTGRTALVADIRRELAALDQQLDARVKFGDVEGCLVGDGYGIFWRLAMLRLYDRLTDGLTQSIDEDRKSHPPIPAAGN